MKTRIGKVNKNKVKVHDPNKMGYKFFKEIKIYKLRKPEHTFILDKMVSSGPCGSHWDEPTRYLN